jgi:hypothetical protein
MYHIFMCCDQRLGLALCIFVVTFVLGLASANLGVFGPLPRVASPDNLGTPVPVELLDLNKSKVVCTVIQKFDQQAPMAEPRNDRKPTKRSARPQAGDPSPGFRFIQPVYRQRCFTVAE